MAHLDRNREDIRIAAMENGSAIYAIGWLFFVVTAVTGIFNFEGFRDGTLFWQTYNGVLGVIALALIYIGSQIRKNNS